MLPKHLQGDLLNCFPPFLLDLCRMTVDPALISWPIYQVSMCQCFSVIHFYFPHFSPLLMSSKYIHRSPVMAELQNVCRAGSQHLMPRTCPSLPHLHPPLLLPQRVSNSSSVSRQATIEQSWTWIMSVHVYETYKVKVMNMEVKTVYWKETVNCQQSVR